MIKTKKELEKEKTNKLRIIEYDKSCKKGNGKEAAIGQSKRKTTK